MVIIGLLRIILLYLAFLAQRYINKYSEIQQNDSEVDSISFRIFNGVETTIAKRPYQVNLETCSGAIIGKRWLITAAHCGDRSSANVGSTKRTEGTSVRIVKRIVHPKYNDEIADYDFAILELAEDLAYSDYVKPVEIGDESDTAPGTMATVSGWGLTEEENVPIILHEVSIPVVDAKECKMLYQKRKSVVTNRMICAGYDKGLKDACLMDSGGPMVANNKLIGLTSWGSENCGEPNSPGVYAKVPVVRSWIKKVTGI